MNETARLAEFAADLRYGDLPADVVALARSVVLDSLGVQLAASTTPWGKAVARYVAGEGGRSESTVVGIGTRTTAGLAALANGTFAHGIEMDDVHPASAVHAGTVVVPAALAVAEREHSAGRELLTSMVAGYEIMVRIGLAVTPVYPERGQHNTGATGAVGAAAIAGSLLGLNAGTMHHAIAISAGDFVGIQEHTQAGGQAKRSYPGMAANDGIRAALLAREGLTGPATALEGDKGFCRLLCDKPEFDRLTWALGTEWTLREVMFKIYATDGFIQPMMECLSRLSAEAPIDGRQVAHIEIGTNWHAIKIASIPEPHDILAAQFSAQFCTALFLLKGAAGFRQFTEENLHDPEIRDLARRVTLIRDEELDRELQRTRGALMVVTMRDGAVRSQRVKMLRSMTDVEREIKFRDLAAGVIPAARIDQLIRAVASLETAPNVATLGPLLVGRPA